MCVIYFSFHYLLLNTNEKFVHDYMLNKYFLLQGCDASILLATPKAEREHPDDISLAGDGFDTVVKAKAAVDRDPKCRNKVSCADILALATRDVVNLVPFISSLSLIDSYNICNSFTRKILCIFINYQLEH